MRVALPRRTIKSRDIKSLKLAAPDVIVDVDSLEILSSWVI